jgi:hypothetical protein
LQVTPQTAPPQLICAGQLPAPQVTRVSCVAPLSIKFWQASCPLHSSAHSAVVPPQLTLPGQLFWPLQRTSQLAASQRTSLMQAPCFSQRTSHELPAQVTFPAQLLSPPQFTIQLLAPLQSTPLEQEPAAVQSI